MVQQMDVSPDRGICPDLENDNTNCQCGWQSPSACSGMKALVHDCLRCLLQYCIWLFCSFIAVQRIPRPCSNLWQLPTLPQLDSKIWHTQEHDRLHDWPLRKSRQLITPIWRSGKHPGTPEPLALGWCLPLAERCWNGVHQIARS